VSDLLCFDQETFSAEVSSSMLNDVGTMMHNAISLVRELAKTAKLAG